MRCPSVMYMPMDDCFSGGSPAEGTPPRTEPYADDSLDTGAWGSWLAAKKELITKTRRI